MLEEFYNDTPLSTSETKTKSYLQLASTIPGFYQKYPLEIKKLKVAAIKDLEKDLIAISKNFEEIYQIFLQVKMAEKGILRYRSEHMIPDQYGNTDSYGNAIRLFISVICQYTYDQRNQGENKQPLVKLLDFKSYQQYQQLCEIFQEAFQCGHYTNDYTLFVKNTKPRALKCFINEVAAKTTVTDVLLYYRIAQIPNNILRVHTENLYKKEGNTDSYKEAIYTIASHVMTLGEFELTKDRPVLLEILEELKKIKPMFDSGSKWQKLIDDFTVYITSNGLKKPAQKNTDQFSL